MSEHQTPDETRIPVPGQEADQPAPTPLPREPGYEDAMGELPPNVPPGILGETGFDLRKVDDDGPHGLNAGLIQEWTWEMTMLVVFLAYVIFFPAAYVILWRSRVVPQKHKVVLSTIMTVGIGVVVFLFATGALYFS